MSKQRRKGEFSGDISQKFWGPIEGEYRTGHQDCQGKLNTRSWKFTCFEVYRLNFTLKQLYFGQGEDICYISGNLPLQVCRWYVFVIVPAWNNSILQAIFAAVAKC